MVSEHEPPTSGCGTCDEVNLSNAANGILQLVSCKQSDVDSVDEAVELVRASIGHRLEGSHAE